MNNLTDEELKDIVWNTRYASDTEGVDRFNAAVEELVERGYSEIA